MGKNEFVIKKEFFFRFRANQIANPESQLNFTNEFSEFQKELKDIGLEAMNSREIQLGIVEARPEK